MIKAQAAVEIGNAFLPENSVFRGSGGTIGNLVSKLLPTIYISATTLTAVYFVIGAVQFIYSGGDAKVKEAARKKIQYAVMGFALVAASFIMVQFLGKYIKIGPNQRIYKVCKPPPDQGECRLITCIYPQVVDRQAYCPDPYDTGCWGCNNP